MTGDQDTAADPESRTATAISGILGLIGERFAWSTPTEPATARTRLRDELDLDSIHLVELQAALEDRFGVVFDPADEQLLDAFDTVGSLADYVLFLLERSS